MNEEPVKRSDIRKRLSPIVAAAVIPSPERTWTEDQWQKITKGHRATGMDEKWHAYVEADRLFLHRSWTGRCIYEATFTPVVKGWQVIEAAVEADSTHYQRGPDEAETLMLEWVIDGVLLGQWDADLFARVQELRTGS